MSDESLLNTLSHAPLCIGGESESKAPPAEPISQPDAYLEALEDVRAERLAWRRSDSAPQARPVRGGLSADERDRALAVIRSIRAEMAERRATQQLPTWRTHP